MRVGWMWESFCEYVGAVVLGGNVGNLNFLGGNAVANMEIFDVNVFGACMELMIVRIGDCCLVVA